MARHVEVGKDVAILTPLEAGQRVMCLEGRESLFASRQVGGSNPEGIWAVSAFFHWSETIAF